jgi:4-hydroxybenzoate polyprenyltransferase
MSLNMSTPPSGRHHAIDLNDIVFNDWISRWLPRAWQPYARLCRLDRPIGIWLTLLPTLAALVQAAAGWPEPFRVLVFSVGALLMRSIGCTINDIFDRNIDKHVERTRHRPLTSGQLTLKQALWFLFTQLLLCAALLFAINPLSRWLALGLLPLVILYPLCKRIIDWPQAVLGICFNWGMLMAWSDTRNAIPTGAIIMYVGTLLWQIGYDTIYAYIDVRDDQRLGLHSTALRFSTHGKPWITGFYLAALLCWSAGGHTVGMSWPYGIGMVLIAIHLAWQLKRLDLTRPELGLRLFRANLWIGIMLAAASILGSVPDGQPRLVEIHHE